MIIIKVTNLRKASGETDYKGLDIDKIKGGSQLYPSTENAAYFEYDGEVVEGGDISVITQATYDEQRERIENQPKPLSPEQEEIAQLKKSQADQDEIIMNLVLGGM